MKKLFLSNMGLSPLHLGTELELLDQSIQAGEDVYILKCNNQFDSCYFNPCHNLLGCAICTARTDRFHQLLGIPKSNIFSIEFLLHEIDNIVPTFKSLKELINYEYQGVNIGRGVASSVISLERNYEILENDRQVQLINVQFKMALNALLNYRKIIEKIEPDEVYLFNGRFAEQFPLVEYCRTKKIQFYTYERGANNKKYQLFKNSLPHSIKTRKQIMHALWKEGDERINKRIAQEWFEAKRAGKNTDDKNYLGKQKKNKLPKTFNPNQHNIAIFNSSEDEMKAIGEWENDLYANQNEAIGKIIKSCGDLDPNIHFYLRMHPNLGKVDNQQTKELYSLHADNFTLIPPFDPIDSFALVEACNTSITFGSTIGIEASYWGKPSILFGKSFYDDLDCVYVPSSYDELFKLILERDLQPKSKEHTLKYGYFVNSFGEESINFNFNGKYESTFKGVKMDRITLNTFSKVVKYASRFPLWKKLNKVILNRKLSFNDLFLLKSHTIDN